MLIFFVAAETCFVEVPLLYSFYALEICLDIVNKLLSEVLTRSKVGAIVEISLHRKGSSKVQPSKAENL